MMLPTLREGLRMPFSQFWPLYLDAHRQPGTRLCHYLASFCGLTGSLLAAVEGEILIMIGSIIGAYCIAIGSHKMIERNQPLIGVNPLYGAAADVRMCWHALRGDLANEYIRLGLRPVSVPAAAVKER